MPFRYVPPPALRERFSHVYTRGSATCIFPLYRQTLVCIKFDNISTIMGLIRVNKMAYSHLFVLIIRAIYIRQSQISVYNSQNLQHFFPMLLGVMWLNQDYSARSERILQYNTLVLPALKSIVCHDRTI